MSNARTIARRLMQESLDHGDPLAWFDRLYGHANGNTAAVPWADCTVNSHLAEWLSRLSGRGLTALDVGCGLGDNAEALATAGYDVTAFDISPSAVAWAQSRFPDSTVRYCVADLLTLGAEWQDKFDLVVEAYTLQVLPPAERIRAMRALESVTSPHGTLLLICRAREFTEPEGAMPWPLTRAEITDVLGSHMTLNRWDDFMDHEVPPVRRFLIEFIRK